MPLRIMCLFGQHKRSTREAFYQDSQLYSRCKFCGVGMRKAFRDGWIVDRLAPQKASDVSN